MDNFWKQPRSAKEYSKKGFEINSLGTHPTIIEMIHKYKAGNKVLDFGCGDGELLFKLGKDFFYSIYDINEKMLELAKNKLKGFNLKIFESPVDIPEKHYDITILSMVLICVDEVEEINSILKKLKQSKNEDGICIIAIPHPCFRDESFSSYQTEFTLGKEFNYFKNGQPHTLYMRDTNISFTDYNWTLSFILNSLHNFEFNLIEMIELRDNKTNSFYNELSSPSIILICK